jgi:membrane protease YdiL (CAAX protease family)
MRLRFEFLVLFVAAPALMATVLPPRLFGEALIGMVVAGVLLLLTTPGFRWRSLIEGPVVRDWPLTLAFSALTGVVTAALVMALIPERFLALPRQNPELWLMILLLYPLLSVVPQELFYRALFFERYGGLFPDVRIAIAVNVLCFGLAHAFYGNWPAVLLTTLGGVAFTWAYVQRRSFVLACLLHAVGGQIVFTSGLGIFFYHGAIPSGG